MDKNPTDMMTKVVAREKLKLRVELIGMDPICMLPRLCPPTTRGGELWGPAIMVEMKCGQGIYCQQ